MGILWSNSSQLWSISCEFTSSLDQTNFSLHRKLPSVGEGIPINLKHVVGILLFGIEKREA